MKKELFQEVKRLRSFHRYFLPRYDLVIFDADFTGNVYLVPVSNKVHYLFDSCFYGRYFKISYFRNSKGYCVINEVSFDVN